MPHVRHRRRNIEQSLLAKIEFLRQHGLFRGHHAQPLLQKIEPAADRERRRSEHHGIELLKKLVAQDLAHVNRRGRQNDSLAAPLVPIDVTLFLALEQESRIRAAVPRHAAPE